MTALDALFLLGIAVNLALITITLNWVAFRLTNAVLVRLGREPLVLNREDRSDHQQHRQPDESEREEGPREAVDTAVAQQDGNDDRRTSHAERQLDGAGRPDGRRLVEQTQLEDERQQQHGVDLREGKALVSGELHGRSVGPNGGDRR